MTKDLFYKIEGSGIPVLLIHGFTGSHKSFQKVSSFLSSQFKVITVDMIGHGQSMNYESKNYTFDKSINDLNKILDSLSIKKINLIGYSLGGRLAMQFALKNIAKLSSLIICSASYGIEKKEDRENRVLSDKKIVTMLENKPIETFVKYWKNLDIWDSEKNLSVERRNKINKIRLSQNKIGLALNLSYQGQGKQEFIGNKLKKIKTKSLIMYGSNDSKYKEMSKEISKEIQNSKLLMVPNSGHNIILENPIFVAQEIKKFVLGEINGS